MMGAMVGASAGSGTGIAASLGVGMLVLLVVLAIGVLIAMAMWFAPALVVFNDTAPIDAVRRSFAATLKNIVPFIVYGVIYLVAALIASIPFGLGWVLLAPLVMLSMYTSYRDVFG